ncbi:hypothetical protein Cni_G11324 [Canna indica]|uniref:Protein OBERON 3 n=1 Tax=Canna indica TaxID=4628 RepID=A0AAQ3K631_9LILI|nr:hypothetical protein Cni_G11324 [Canna indica]
MFGDSDHRKESSPNPQPPHPSSGPLDLEASPAKPHIFRDAAASSSPTKPGASAAPQELTLSYLCDNPKPGPSAAQDKDGLASDLFASLEKSRLKGKEIVPDPPNEDDRRWVERDFLQLAGGKPSAKREAPDGAGDGEGREKKVKIETLSLSLAPPNLSLSLNSSIPNAATAATPGIPVSVVPPKKSHSNSLRAANSEDYAPSLSYSCSVPFSHNPSCSLTRNSTENYDYSRGDNDKIWYAGEGTNGSVHSKFKPVGDGNTIAFANHNKELNNSLYRANSSENVSFFPSELPARPAKINGVASSDSGRNGMLTRPDRLLREIASESVPAMAQLLHDFPIESLEALRENMKNLLEVPEKKDEFASLQRKVERRSDLTFEILLKAHKTQLEILVAIKTGIVSYVSGKIHIPPKELAEIFSLMRCRNVNCKSALPVDDCDCKICSTKKGFCSACMCPVCLKFDSSQNTCGWVGCDNCSHWCHAVCGIEKNLIRPGRSSKGPIGMTEMQFQCLGCGHASEMFGFVKDVFNECAKNWAPDILMKELDCVRKIFRASEDFEGKGLHGKAEETLNMLSKKVISPKDACASMLQFFKYGVTEFSVTGSSSKNILAQANPLADASLPSAAGINVSKTTMNFTPASSMLDKQIDALKTDAKPLSLEPHFTSSKDDRYKSLETIVKCKEAEAKFYQRLADEARREVEGYRQIVRAKSDKLEEEYATKIAKLALQETEERRRKKLEERKFLENSHCDYQNMKMRMQAEIAGLLERMEATKKMWV